MASIHFKILGKRKPYFIQEAFSSKKEKYTLQSLLEEITQYQVKEFNTRHTGDYPFKVLTQNEISENEIIGRLNTTPKETHFIDIDKAFETVLLAFEDKLFFVFINDQRIENLSDEIVLSSNSEILFLKLTFISGSYLC